MHQGLEAHISTHVLGKFTVKKPRELIFSDLNSILTENYILKKKVVKFPQNAESSTEIEISKSSMWPHDFTDKILAGPEAGAHVNCFYSNSNYLPPPPQKKKALFFCGRVNFIVL